MSNIIEVIEEDHEEILKRLKKLEETISGGTISEEDINYFLDFDENVIRPHHEKEKNILFSKLLEAYPFAQEEGIDDALLEYKIKDHYIDKIREAIEAEDNALLKKSIPFVIGLLRDRIHKEKTLYLF